jgi:hypothetical protein
MGFPRLEISRGTYIQIYTPPSPLVQAALNLHGRAYVESRPAQTARLDAKCIRKPGDRRKIRELLVLIANQDLASQGKES